MSEDKISQLERLAKLLKDGILSEAEFEQQKKELLGTSTPSSNPNLIAPKSVQKKPEQKKASGCMTLIIIMVGLIALSVIYGALNSGSADDKSGSVNSTTNTPTSRSEVVQGFFSAWDGSHGELESSIKKGMNDPDSYEHVETRFRDDGKTIYVITKFRDKNAFGGTIVNGVTATLDGNTGKLLEWEYVK